MADSSLCAGAQTSLVLDPEHATTLQHLNALTGASVEPAPASAVSLGGRRGAAAASPFVSATGGATLSVTAGQLPVISEVRLNSENSLDLGLRRSADFGPAGGQQARRRSIGQARRDSLDRQQQGGPDYRGRSHDFAQRRGADPGLRRSTAAWGAGGNPSLQLHHDPALPVVEEEGEEGEEGQGAGEECIPAAGDMRAGSVDGGSSSSGGGSAEDSLVEELAAEAKLGEQHATAGMCRGQKKVAGLACVIVVLASSSMREAC